MEQHASLSVSQSDDTRETTKTGMHIVDQWAGREKHILVLSYTLACPLSCDFCCYGCHPRRPEKMPLDLALDLVDQAADMGVFSSVGLTGGEAMMFLEDVLAIGDRLQRRGLPFTIATAAHWATSLGEARRIIDQLAERGLCRINLSADPSHEKFVPPERVVNAAIAADERGLPTIITGVFNSTDERLATRRPVLADLEHVRLLDKLVGPVGRAAKWNISQEKLGLDLALGSLCCYRQQYHDLVVFYDGTAYPCCSTFNRATPGLIVGNASTERLLDIWERVEGSLMYRIMKRRGFSRIYEIIDEYDPELRKELPSVGAVAGACHLCHAIFKDPALAKRVHELFERYERSKFEAAFEAVVELIGADAAQQLAREMIAGRGAAGRSNHKEKQEWQSRRRPSAP